MSYFFISYKSEQRNLAFLVRDKLKEWGFDAWLDVDRLKPGTYWADKINEALKTCLGVVGIVTPQSLTSRYVTNEWDMAIMLGKLFIPLMYERTDPHYKYIDIQYIDFTDTNLEKPFNQLRDRLNEYNPNTYNKVKNDPYYDYLSQLYERINYFLSQKLVSSLKDNEGRPEPIRLGTQVTVGAVDALFQKKEEIDPLFVIGGIQDEPPSEFDDLNKAFDYYNGRVLLLGSPGSGKTISLLNYGRDAIVKRVQDPTAPLPILGIIPTWDADKAESIPKWLDASYGTPEGTIEIIDAGKALLLLDGLDELGRKRPVNPDEPEGKYYDPRLRFMSLVSQNNQIIITCREQDYHEIGEKIHLNGAITLKPMDISHQRAYLKQQPELMDFISSDDRLVDWLDTPLLLSFFAFTFELMTNEQRMLLQSTENANDFRDQILESYVEKRYNHEIKKPNTNLPYSLESVYEILGVIAMEDARKYDAINHITDRDVALALDRSDRENFVQWMLTLQLMIVGNQNTYHFIHTMLRDFFAYKRSLKKHDSPYDNERVSAIEALGNIADKRALNILTKALNDEYWLIRLYAAYGLGNYKGLAPLNYLGHLLKHDDIEDVRSAAATALGEIENESVIPLLIEALEDSHRRVRRASVQSLGKLRASTAVKKLEPLLNDPDPWVREFTLETLELIDTPEAKEVINKFNAK